MNRQTSGHSAILDELFEAILSLEDLDECYNFFEDLCTVSELKEMSRRMLAAKMLRENYIYSEIAAQTGLSFAARCPSAALRLIPNFCSRSVGKAISPSAA